MEKRKRDVDAHECHSHTDDAADVHMSATRACGCEKEKRMRETERGKERACAIKRKRLLAFVVFSRDTFNKYVANISPRVFLLLIFRSIDRV